jgi:hypothetical protein
MKSTFCEPKNPEAHALQSVAAKCKQICISGYISGRSSKPLIPLPGISVASGMLFRSPIPLAGCHLIFLYEVLVGVRLACVAISER